MVGADVQLRQVGIGRHIQRGQLALAAIEHLQRGRVFDVQRLQSAVADLQTLERRAATDVQMLDCSLRPARVTKVQAGQRGAAAEIDVYRIGKIHPIFLVASQRGAAAGVQIQLAVMIIRGDLQVHQRRTPGDVQPHQRFGSQLEGLQRGAMAQVHLPEAAVDHHVRQRHAPGQVDVRRQPVVVAPQLAQRRAAPRVDRQQPHVVRAVQRLELRQSAHVQLRDVVLIAQDRGHLREVPNALHRLDALLPAHDTGDCLELLHAQGAVAILVVLLYEGAEFRIREVRRIDLGRPGQRRGLGILGLLEGRGVRR